MYKTHLAPKFKALITTTLLIATMSSCSKSKLNYPAAPQDGTTYEAFGTVVDDRFRPLENDTAAATAEWVAAENALTNEYLSQIPYRDSLRTRLGELNNYSRQSIPARKRDGKLYFYANDGTSNQDIMYRADSLGGEREVFIDPNTLSDEGIVALKSTSFNSDGTLAAYVISRSGSDWAEIYVMDPVTKELKEDHIEWAKFTGVDWYGDGFYYSAYDRPEAGKEFSNTNEYHRVYYHKLGTPQSEDVVVYENREQPLHFHSAYVLDDRYLFITASGEGNGNALYIKDLTKPNSGFRTIEASQDYEISPFALIDGKVYATTNMGAPRSRVVAIDPNRPEPANWVEIIPEDPEGGVLADIKRAGEDRMILNLDRDAASHAYVYDNSGRRLREIEFPTFGNAYFSCSKRQPEVFYSFSSFTYPATVYSYDLNTGESTEVFSPDIEGFDPEDYITEQVFYTSKDGTRVPMFIVRHKNTVADGTNPTYLYGYGGFNISLTPTFSNARLLWLENGGIYASANLRGGNEYGEDWHLAGTKMNKQNVFDDFISAAEYLIAENWTTPELLTIEGGSNGGLLVGAVVNQRPELFKVAIPRVGVMDMMRYHLFTIGWNWASDYGTADESPEMAQYLLGYSPLHTIRDGVDNYPAILVTTADHDDRVVPAHSFKYAAALQAAETGPAPKLIRIESEAGHGAGKPLSKILDEYADIYSFIYYNLGIDPTAEN